MNDDNDDKDDKEFEEMVYGSQSESENYNDNN